MIYISQRKVIASYSFTMLQNYLLLFYFANLKNLLAILAIYDHIFEHFYQYTLAINNS